MMKQSKLYKKMLGFNDHRVTYKMFYRECAEALKQFQNIHIGERCFIVGNGPSLRCEDLDMLKQEITFGSNYIYKIFNKTDWRPTYYFNSDNMVLKKMINDPQFWEFNVRTRFFQYDARFVFENKKPMDSVYFYVREDRDFNKYPKFATNIVKEIYNAWTITYIMMQIAVCMGIKVIYLLGIDNSYSIEVDNKGKIRNNSVSDSFVAGGNVQEMSGHLPNVQRMNMGYVSAYKFAKKHNIKIYNATRGGQLETFQRVSFDDLF